MWYSKTWPLGLLTILWFSAPTTTTAATKKLLFVGNSYTAANAPNTLRDLFASMAKEGVPNWTSIETEQVTKGGYTLEKHAVDAGQPGTQLNKVLVEMLSGPFDFVVLQEQSQIPGFHAANSPLWLASLEAATTLDDYAELAQSNTVFFMTWGRRSGDQDNFQLYPDYLTMQSLLAQGYEIYAKETTSSDRITTISPVGRAFQELYEQEISTGTDPLDPESLFSRLYAPDGSHPSILGTYLSAAVLFASLSGRDPTLLTTKPDSISTLDRDRLLKLARDIVTDKAYDHYASIWGPLPRYPWVKPYETPPGGDLVIGTAGPQTTVYLASSTPPIDTIALGKSDSDAGRLGILDGGSLKVEQQITVGVEGIGRLECLGGTLNAGKVMVGQGVNAVGRLDIAGGTLDVESITTGSGSAVLSMVSGQLRTGSIGFGWEQAGGTWSLPGDGSVAEVTGNYSLDDEATLRFTLLSDGPDQVSTSTLSVKGSVTLRGKIAIDTPGGVNITKETEVILMVGESFSAEDLDIDLPAGSSWEIVPHQTVLFAFKLKLVPTSTSPVVFDPPPGSYDAPLDVTLTAADGATIHFTTDGSSVSQNSPSAASPFVVQLSDLGAHTLRAIAVNTFGISSQPTGGSYLLLPPPVVTASPGAGQYDAPLTITLSTDRVQSTIYWTVDGSSPDTKAAMVYEEPIVLSEVGSYTLNARAVADSGVEGPILSVQYDVGSITVADEGTADVVQPPDNSDLEPHDMVSDVVSAEPLPKTQEGCTGRNPSRPTPTHLLWLFGLFLIRHRGRVCKHQG